MPDKVNLAEKLGTFSDRWAPRIVTRYNGNEVRIAKVEGEFIWHQHNGTDELFLILDGELDMEFRDRTVTMRPGELIVIPRGNEHRPCARNGEVSMMMIDLEDTPNTGDEATATRAVEI
jgi:mannose-6-phosphate isomerase-like protein (cupin superfamily)